MVKILHYIFFACILFIQFDYLYADVLTAYDQHIVIDEDMTVDIELYADSVDGGIISYTIVDHPVNGMIVGQPPNITYIPNSDYFGFDKFTFQAIMDKKYSNIANINITVNQVVDAPVAFDQSLNTLVNTPIPITLSGDHIDGEQFEFEITDYPSNGKLSGNIPFLLYEPQDSFIGEDKFLFKTKTEYLDSRTATVTISVIEENKDYTDNDDSSCFILLIKH